MPLTVRARLRSRPSLPLSFFSPPRHRPERLRLAAKGSKDCQTSGLRPTPRPTHPLLPLAFVPGARGTKGSLIEHVERHRSHRPVGLRLAKATENLTPPRICRSSPQRSRRCAASAHFHPRSNPTRCATSAHFQRRSDPVWCATPAHFQRLSDPRRCATSAHFHPRSDPAKCATSAHPQTGRYPDKPDSVQELAEK
jgi:hypothetical protein